MIRLGAVGDVVRTLPAVATLREAVPHLHISWLVEPASESALREQPWIDDVIVFPRAEWRDAISGVKLARLAELLRNLRDALRRPRFDLVLDFHAILKSGLLSRFCGAPMRVSYARPFAREASFLFATHRAELSPTRLSRFARNQGLPRFLGIAASPPPRPFVVSDAARVWTRSALGGAFANADDKAGGFVAVHPGTSAHTPHKRWPLGSYAALTRRLPLPTLVTFGPDPGERRAAEAVVAASRGHAQLAPATPTLDHMAALLEAASLYVGGDTGPLHVASLVGTPVLQLMGPTDPVENEPYGETPFRRVRVPLDCSPCRRGCAAAPCMRRIEVGDVEAAAASLLGMAVA